MTPKQYKALKKKHDPDLLNRVIEAFNDSILRSAETEDKVFLGSADSNISPKIIRVDCIGCGNDRIGKISIMGR